MTFSSWSSVKPTRPKLLEDEDLVLRRIELPARLEGSNCFYAVSNLRVGRLDTEFFRLMVYDEKVPDKFIQSLILVLTHSAQVFEQRELPHRQSELISLDLTLDIRLGNFTPVDGGDRASPQLIGICGIVEPDKGDNRQDGDHQHEHALVFSKNGNHERAAKLLICRADVIKADKK